MVDLPRQKPRCGTDFCAAEPFFSFDMLTLTKTVRYFGFGNPDDYVVLNDCRVIGRILLHPQAPAGQPGSGQSPQAIRCRLSITGATQQHANKRWRISKSGGLSRGTWRVSAAAPSADGVELTFAPTTASSKRRDKASAG